MTIAFFTAGIVIGSVPGAGFGGTEDQETKEFLHEFHADPARAMALGPKKVSPLPEKAKFASIEEAVKLRTEMRDHLCQSPLSECRPKRPHLFQEIGERDLAKALLAGEQTVYRLAEMEERALTAAELEKVPWSDHYWPFYKGTLGWRYLDRNFPGDDFLANHGYVVAAPPGTVDARVLSPAEKYDLLVGDASGALTKANWDRGWERLEQGKSILDWMGICDGWAAAASMEEEPKDKVEVLAADGTPLVFYPSDIKALASSMWSDNAFTWASVGQKCLVSAPARDEVGRVVDPDCFTTNPGTWHLSIVNQIGVLKQHMVMDATYDLAVWNQPVFKYHYSYFNPQTLEVSDRLFGSVVPIEQYAIDKFKKYRSPKARYVVGIAMTVTYVDESWPSSSGRKETPKVRVRYVYDLELDADHKIIGGEWYHTKHPDFIWAPVPGSRPISKGELALGAVADWDGFGPVPENLARAAQVSSPEREPVSAIVRGLIKRSQRSQQ